MKVQYLSHFINQNTPAYGGSKNQVKIIKTSSILNGDTANTSEITINNHIGTHIDFPYHFSNSGKKSTDYDASFWVFNKIGFINCKVDKVLDEIVNLPNNIEFLILKTNFQQYRNKDDYWRSQPVIPSSYAKILKNKFPKLRLFGFDMISLTSKLDRNEGKKAHLAFLIENDILILEDMNLEYLKSTPKSVIVSPLQISKIDGVPCNVIAFK